uniref:N-acetylaspartate synthetase n=1 Tax=Neogobius melanostomus TaxID=47308 RepID=A0A8C6T118_9GOBI
MWKDLKTAVHKRSPSNVTELELFCKEEWAKMSVSRSVEMNTGEPIVVREFESRDEQDVRRIFSEGMREMVTDTAFRGLRHHPESLLIYLVMTGVWISSCWWVIVLLPVAILYARCYFSHRVTLNSTKHALRTDMADIERFYTKAPGSCVWVAVMNNQVVGLVAAKKRSREVVELMRMSVDHRYRCRGVGMVLGRRVVEYASTQGFAKVVLGTTNYTQAPHNLYRRLGFQCVGVTNGYTVSAAPGPSLLERLFYRVKHHHYELELQHKENLK